MEIVKSRYPRTATKQKLFFMQNYDPTVSINILQTAKSIGVSRMTIYNWMNEAKNK
jgi:transposase